MPLPANVGFGTVTGRFMDSHGVNLEGTITFTPSPSRLLNTAATEGPVTILPKPVTATLADGSFSTTLVATDDPDNNPSGWTYRVDFRLTGVTVGSFSIEVPEGSTVNLTTVAPVPAANGTMYVNALPSGGTEGQVLQVVAGEPTWSDPATGGGGTELTSYSTQVATLADYPTEFPPDLSSVTPGTIGAQPAGDYALNSAIPTWSSLSGKPAVIAAGTSQTAARDAIGAGTSNLALGVGPTTAKAGDWVPAWTDVTGKPNTFPAEAHTHDLDETTDTATRVAMTPAERTKLSGVATGATANASDAQLRDRATHTGTQAISTVTGLQTALDGKQAAGSYAAATHSHATADVTGLDTALTGKEDKVAGAKQTVTFASTADTDARPTASTSVSVMWLTTYSTAPANMANGDLQFEIGV